MGYAEILRENASIRPPEIRAAETEVQPVVEIKDDAPNKKRVKKWG
jgi:hypothetical protein